MENKNFRINKNPRLKKLSVKRTNFLNYKQQLKHSTRHEYDATIKFAKKRNFLIETDKSLKAKHFLQRLFPWRTAQHVANTVTKNYCFAATVPTSTVTM